MSSYPITQLTSAELPPLLTHIPDPPASLTYRGTLPAPALTLLAVVGSRRYTTYGKQVVHTLIEGLRGYPVGIVSGLALGIDSLAHQAALEANLYTLAVPGSGLADEVLYPRTHRGLAKRILEAGGGLLSEFDPKFQAAPWAFPQRNRIIAGIAHATLIIEAATRSGSLITARLAAEYNRELMVVPGSIFSPQSAGCHQFLALGAHPVTSAEDIAELLNVTPATESAPTPAFNPESEEALVLAALNEPCDRDTLLARIKDTLPPHVALRAVTALELEGYIRTDDGVLVRVR